MTPDNDLLTWRDGAARDAAHVPVKRPGVTPDPCFGEETVKQEVFSITELIAQKRVSADLDRFRASVWGFTTIDTQTLILRIATTTDPLTLWAIHCALDTRGIPPALRWPQNDENPQAVFITYCADLLWFCKRNPTHLPLYRGWRGIFTHPPGTPGWHATVYRQFLFVYSRYALSFKTAKGLALTDVQRQGLMVLQTNAMHSERRQLRPDDFASLREHLLNHAIEHPDKSGQHRSDAIANRRASLWRVYVLSGRSKVATVKNWRLLTGDALSRQGVTKQLSIVKDVQRNMRGKTLAS